MEQKHAIEMKLDLIHAGGNFIEFELNQGKLHMNKSETPTITISIMIIIRRRIMMMMKNQQKHLSTNIVGQ